jgi:hypothetical protein
MRVSTKTHERVLDLFANTTWGDMTNAIDLIDLALTIAMEATRVEFATWEAWVDEGRYEYEFLDPAAAALLPADVRLALLARLARTMAMAWGLGTDFGVVDDLGEVRNDPDTASTLLRQLLELALGENQAPDPDEPDRRG